MLAGWLKELLQANKCHFVDIFLSYTGFIFNKSIDLNVISCTKTLTMASVLNKHFDWSRLSSSIPSNPLQCQGYQTYQSDGLLKHASSSETLSSNKYNIGENIDNKELYKTAILMRCDHLVLLYAKNGLLPTESDCQTFFTHKDLKRILLITLSLWTQNGFKISSSSMLLLIRQQQYKLCEELLRKRIVERDFFAEQDVDLGILVSLATSENFHLVGLLIESRLYSYKNILTASVENRLIPILDYFLKNMEYLKTVTDTNFRVVLV